VADPVVLRAIENLATVRLAQKQYAEAKRLFERARKVWEELRPGVPEAAIALNGLGAVALRNKRKAQAAMLFRDAIYRGQPDTEPLLLAQVLGNLARAVGPRRSARSIHSRRGSGGEARRTRTPFVGSSVRCRGRMRPSASLYPGIPRQVRQENPTGLLAGVSLLK
jgi:tetratricopeptide (TPR) repeat protein